MAKSNPKNLEMKIACILSAALINLRTFKIHRVMEKALEYEKDAWIPVLAPYYFSVYHGQLTYLP